MGKKKNWIVTMRCEVVKEVYCSRCTEEEARKDPWKHCYGDPIEIDMVGWEIIRVEENG